MNEIIFLLKCFLNIALGAFVSYGLIKSGQNWAKSYSNTTTFLILPLIGFVITSVISGNIALSLGMVGALSIIRFRHPVKSPLELSIYFLLLSIGITISSSWEKSIVLSFLSILVIFIYSYIKSKKNIFSDTLPINQYVKNETSYIIDIYCYGRDVNLAKNSLSYFSLEKQRKFIFQYKLGFHEKAEAEKLLDLISDDANVKELKYSCV